MEATLQFFVLGPLQARRDSGVAEIPGHRERALLDGLLLTPGEQVEVDRLLGLLWPGQLPRNPARALRTHVMRLRRHLGRELVETSLGAYAIHVERESVDAHRFSDVVTGATLALYDRRLARAETMLAHALDIWHQGAPWIDLAGTRPGDAERARLVEERLEVEERLAAVRLCLRRPPLDEIEKLALEKPLREGRWLLLMHALSITGQQSRALRCYSSLRVKLRYELGLNPDRRLQDMEHRILAQDPTLLDIDPLSLVFG
jgi:DNA-binding SARP family transcriptional activator